jgi:hypothetical protein
MLPIVTCVHVAYGSAVKEISQEEGAFPLIPSSINFSQLKAVWMLSSECFRRHRRV